MFDGSYSLLQFIECRSGSLEQSTAVNRQFDTPRAAIEKSHADRVLEAGYQFRHGGLGDAKPKRRFCHAAALHDRDKYVQIPQLEAAADLNIPVDFSRHGNIPNKLSLTRNCDLILLLQSMRVDFNERASYD